MRKITAYYLSFILTAIITISIVSAASPYGVDANSCTWVEDPMKDDTTNLRELLECLAATETVPLLKRHFESIVMVMNHPNSSYLAYMDDVRGAIDFFTGEGQDITTYTDRSKHRQLIMAFQSASDGTVSYYRLGLPTGWDENKTDYPMYLNLHGSGGGANDNPLQMMLPILQVAPPTYSIQDTRGNGYHVVPWGRGDQDYEGQAGTDIHEVLADFDAMYQTNPVQQYMYGFSMGGGGTYKIFQDTPDRWAAIGLFSPCLFEPDPFEARLFAHTPIWHWWGEIDGCSAVRSNMLVEYFNLANIEEYNWHEEPATGHTYGWTQQIEMMDYLEQWTKGRPYMDKIEDVSPLLTGSGEQYIKLTGISDGSGGTQTVSISAISADPSSLQINSVNYPGGDTALIYFEPLAEADVIVTVRLQDDGGTAYGVSDTSFYTFTASVFDVINENPTIDQINIDSILEDVNYQIKLTGISDGDGTSQNITFDFWVLDTTIVSTPSVDYTQGEDTAVLNITSALNAYGKTMLNIVVNDDGGNGSNNGDASITIPLDIKVVNVNDAPSSMPPVDQSPISADAGETDIYLILIDDGDEGVEEIVDVIIYNDNPTLFTSLYYEKATNSAGIIKYTPAVDQSGEANIIITLKDDGGLLNGGIDSVRYSFKITITPSTSIISDMQTDELIVFPNPANNKIEILGLSIFNDLSIIDITGSVYYNSQLFGENSKIIELTEYPTGMYFISITNNSKTIVKKIIVQN